MHSALNQNFFLEINMGTLFQMNKKKNLYFIAAHWITTISTKVKNVTLRYLLDRKFTCQKIYSCDVCCR